MNKGIRTLAWALAAAIALARAASAAPAAGVVISLQGRPQVKAAGKSDYSRLKMNQLVYEGDTLKTDKGERLGVAFVGGAEVRINEESVFTVENGGGSRPTSVFSTLGDCWARMISGHGGVQVRTPMAVAAVRGTEADIDVGDHLAVKVYEGLVDVMNDKGKTSLKAGQQTSVAGIGQAPQAAKAMAPADYRKWQDGVKPANLDKSLAILNKAATDNRTLELNMKNKDGSQKKVKLNFQKK